MRTDGDGNEPDEGDAMMMQSTPRVSIGDRFVVYVWEIVTCKVIACWMGRQYSPISKILFIAGYFLLDANEENPRARLFSLSIKFLRRKDENTSFLGWLQKWFAL